MYSSFVNRKKKDATPETETHGNIGKRKKEGTGSGPTAQVLIVGKVFETESGEVLILCSIDLGDIVQRLI